MIQLAELVEEEGLLSLEDEISTECNNMLPSEIKKMMNYIVLHAKIIINFILNQKENV